MKARGYMQEVELTDTHLSIEGTNKASRVALRGERHADGPVVLPLGDIVGVEHKFANVLVNGKVIVRTAAGESYTMHFRKKSNDEFAALAASLA